MRERKKKKRGERRRGGIGQTGKGKNKDWMQRDAEKDGMKERREIGRGRMQGKRKGARTGRNACFVCHIVDVICAKDQ